MTESHCLQGVSVRSFLPARSVTDLGATGPVTNDTTQGESAMSQPKVIGSAAAATLPLTGNGVVGMVLAGIALVVVGLLLVRSGRYRNAA